MLVGDVNLLRKVYNFLEYWGLINYHVTSENKQQQSITSGEQIPSNHSASNNKPKEMLAESIAVTRPESNTATLSEALPQAVPGSALSSSQAGQPVVRMLDQPVSMSHATRVPLHKDTYSSSVVTSSMEGIGDSQNMANEWLGNWTMEEVLRLLEAVGKFGEDWIRVAAHVGTKSRLDCVLRFIKLPFGDQLTSNIGVSPYPIDSGEAIQSGSQVGGYERKENDFATPSLDRDNAVENFGSDEVIDEPPYKKNRLSPFADSSNPILAQVAFLCAMVGPRVAAAAAQAAVAALAEEDPVVYQALNSSTNAHAVQGGYKDIGALSASQAMSVKGEDAEGEDVLPEKGHQTQASKDAETSGMQARAGSNTAVGSVAANSKLVADQEEREIEHLVASILEDQLRKLQSKVEHYEELESILEKEHSQLEKARLQVLGDWIRYSQYHYNAGPS
ncbi:hypothetical protein GOP47_0025470 [Adiantum capillus-veneris]|nr:hypothetical protein GOP47_0025470 [Adiantum capillus-veneris]